MQKRLDRASNAEWIDWEAITIRLTRHAIMFTFCWLGRPRSGVILTVARTSTSWLIATTIVVGIWYCGLATTTQCSERIYVGAADLWANPAKYRIYVYDVTNLSLLDTIPFVRAFPTDIKVSPSGHRLYVTAQGNGFLYAIYALDPLSHKVLWTYGDTTFDEYPFSFLYENGSRIVFGRNVINAETGALITRLPSDILPFEGPIVGNDIIVAGPFQDPNGFDTLRILDISSGVFTGGILPRLGSGQPIATYWAVLHPDMSRALVLGFAPDTRFALVDLISGTSVTDFPLAYPQGRMSLSPNGKIAVVTDPSLEGIWGTEGTVDVVDIDSLQVLRRFNLGHDPAHFLGQVAFLADGLNAVLAGKPSELGVGTFTLLNLATLEFDTTIVLPFADTLAVAIGGIGIGDSCECCCHCRHDPVCDGLINDVRDVITTIDVVIRGKTPIDDPNLGCTLSPVDADCSGELDLLDVTTVIDIAFRGIYLSPTSCDPCVP